MGGCSWLQLLVLLFAAAVSIGFLSTAYLSHLVFPEIGMVVSSQCSNPLRDWDGKILRVPVARNFLRDRNETGLLSDDPQALREDLEVHSSNESWPVIFWGAHHKAGTYLAQKIFSLVCARRKWCCVFGHSRDSAATMLRAVAGDPVRVMGHNQVRFISLPLSTSLVSDSGAVGLAAAGVWPVLPFRALLPKPLSTDHLGLPLPQGGQRVLVPLPAGLPRDLLSPSASRL